MIRIKRTAKRAHQMAVLLAVRRYMLLRGRKRPITANPRFMHYVDKACRELFENERNRLPIRSIGAYGWMALRNAFVGITSIRPDGMSHISKAVIFREKYKG